jgi:transposase-like protein
MAKSYTTEFKDKAVQEALEAGNVYLVARNYGIAESTLHQWVNNFKKFGSVSLKNVDIELKANLIKPRASNGEQSLEKENESLKKLLGEKELEIQILKDMLKKTNPQLYAKLK